jgi:phosphatidylglycerol:prolipoprotein diacylglycerol transferase
MRSRLLALFAVLADTPIIFSLFRISSPPFMLANNPLLAGVSCFFAGCCYGLPYSGPFSVTYPHIMNKSLFPIQLLEIFVFLSIFIFCNYFYKKKNITYVTLILVSMFKFLLDFLRYNHLYEFISKNQIFSILLCFITIIIYFYNKYKLKKSIN